MFDGHGTLSFNNSDMYVGEFKKGRISGHGDYTFADGEKFVGQFKNGKPVGNPLQ
jgi:hypothetical protein